MGNTLFWVLTNNKNVFISVEITIPPGGLDIETTTYLLMWNPPDKDSSMLSFVLNRRHVLYKVEYREVIDGNTDIEWEVNTIISYLTPFLFNKLLSLFIVQCCCYSNLHSPILIPLPCRQCKYVITNRWHYKNIYNTLHFAAWILH